MHVYKCGTVGNARGPGAPGPLHSRNKSTTRAACRLTAVAEDSNNISYPNKVLNCSEVARSEVCVLAQGDLSQPSEWNLVSAWPWMNVGNLLRDCLDTWL